MDNVTEMYNTTKKQIEEIIAHQKSMGRDSSKAEEDLRQLEVMYKGYKGE